MGLAIVRSEKRLGVLLILPSVLLIGSLLVYPVLYSFWLSLFYKHSFLPVQRFVGLQNYILSFEDPEFWTSFRYGIIYTVGSIALQIGFGVVLALILNESFPGRGLVRAIILFPYLITTVVAVIVWKWLLDASYGLIDEVLIGIGVIREPIVWLGVGNIMASLIFISVWKFFPFVVIAILARLQTIPPELYEAATVDGAGPWKQFCHITLPQIRSVLFVVLLLRGIWMFTKFDVVWLLTEGGGAGRYIQTLPVYAYLQTFSMLNAGRGATLANLMFLFLVAVSFIYFHLFREEEAI